MTIASNPKRKLRYTLEMVHNGQCWIGVNTGRANAIVAEAISAGSIPELEGYDELITEQKYGKSSRIDILLRRGAELCYVEVKNVTLVAADGNYCFPDAVTARGQKHLRELAGMRLLHQRAVVFYLIQRTDGAGFRVAAEIDSAYAAASGEARKHGVEMLAYVAAVKPGRIHVDHSVEVLPEQW